MDYSIPGFLVLANFPAMHEMTRKFASVFAQTSTKIVVDSIDGTKMMKPVDLFELLLHFVVSVHSID